MNAVEYNEYISLSLESTSRFDKLRGVRVVFPEAETVYSPSASNSTRVFSSWTQKRSIRSPRKKTNSSEPPSVTLSKLFGGSAATGPQVLRGEAHALVRLPQKPVAEARYSAAWDSQSTFPSCLEIS